MQCICLQWRLDFKDTAKLFSYYGSSYLSLCKRTIVKSLDTATATTVEILTTSSIRFELKKDRISWNADAFEDKTNYKLNQNYKSLAPGPAKVQSRQDQSQRPRTDNFF